MSSKLTQLSNTFLASAHEISSLCTKPEEVLEAMKRAMKQTIKLVHVRYVVDLLQELARRRIGTNSVENGCKDLCKDLPPRRKNALVHKMMKWKLSDSRRCLQREQYNNTKERRKCKAVLTNNGVVQQFEEIWNVERRRVVESLKVKRKRKIAFLREKYGQSREIPDQIEGITIADSDLPATFNSEPRCYGGCSTDEKEKKILSLPPKFAVYDKVNTVECEAEIEKGLAKLRWTKRKQFEGDKNQQDENKEPEGETKGTVYDFESNTFDFSNMRATDLPFNKRVHLPEPLDEKSEIAMQNLKVKLNQITEKYVRDEKVSKWSNLEKNEKEGLVSMKKKVQSQESVVFQTDKSGRLSVDSMGNYRAVSQPHVVDSVLITKDEHNRLQQLINAHSASWVRILNAGSETNNETRIKNNINRGTGPDFHDLVG